MKKSSKKNYPRIEKLAISGSFSGTVPPSPTTISLSSVSTISKYVFNQDCFP